MFAPEIQQIQNILEAESEKPSAFGMSGGRQSPTEEQPPAEPQPAPPVDVRSFSADYIAIRERHPKDVVLYQVGDSFEMLGPNARIASTLLDLNLTISNLPDMGRVAMCGFPADALSKNIEKLRREYGVTVSQVDKESGNRVVYFMGAYPKDREQIFPPRRGKRPRRMLPPPIFLFLMRRLKAYSATAPPMTAAGCVSLPFTLATEPPRSVWNT